MSGSTATALFYAQNLGGAADKQGNFAEPRSRERSLPLLRVRYPPPESSYQSILYSRP